MIIQILRVPHSI